ncbi:uncharacterized protein [Paramormyrops kingsleyae]|uniref:uncharacterized protein n=1 Tax=Paramormyrops kingsleyae TaxID=1676925 RepID=UPI003B979DA2
MCLSSGCQKENRWRFVSTSNRHFLLCPVCKKTQASLSVHLTRVCMKRSSKEAIQEVVEKAKQDALEVLQWGRVFSYRHLRDIMDDAKPMSRMIQELERRHMVVPDTPSPAVAAQTSSVPVMAGTTVQRPESSATEQSEDAVSVSNGEIFQVTREVQWPQTSRHMMQEKGLYRKHSLDHPLLKGFAAAFDQLLRTHPVTLDGDIPDKTARSQTSGRFQRQLYDRWLKAQMRMRVRHVLSHFGRRQPTESRVDAWIRNQGWKSNVPSAASVLKDWRPVGSVDTAVDSSHIQELIHNQKWKGLVVMDIAGKGKGVCATRQFQAGEVVCDYHGPVVTATEGQ